MTVDCTDYNHKKAAVDEIVMQLQTSSGKLRQKAIQDNPTYEELVKMGISQEQAKKKTETLPDGEGDQITQAVQEELRRLKGGNKGPGGGQEAAQKVKCKRCCLSRCKGKEGCPAEGKQFNTCQEMGHFTRSSLCLYALFRTRSPV